jgi:prophage regulatory protein
MKADFSEPQKLYIQSLTMLNDAPFLSMSKCTPVESGDKPDLERIPKVKQRAQLIDKHELKAYVPYSIQHIYRLISVGKFPPPVQLGARRVAWLLSEIMDWIREKVRQRDQKLLRIAGKE